MRAGTYTEQLQQISNEYLRSRGRGTSREMASWAIDTGRWKPSEGDLVKQLAEQMSRAMREEYIVDAQGRSVRAKHAARLREGGEQLTFWADIRTAKPEHMRIAFQQRRQQIVGDCRQLKLDVDSYNENRRPDSPEKRSVAPIRGTLRVPSTTMTECSDVQEERAASAGRHVQQRDAFAGAAAAHAGSLVG